MNSEEWSCRSCGTSNGQNRTECRRCNKRRDDTQACIAFFDSVVTGSVEPKTPEEAVLFIRGMREHPKPTEMIGAATRRRKRTEMRFLHAVVSTGASVEFYNAHLIPLLGLLGSDELSCGLAAASRDVVLRAIFETPSWISHIANIVEELDDPVSLAWLVNCMLNSSDQEFALRAQENEDVLFLVDELCALPTVKAKYGGLLQSATKRRVATVVPQDSSLKTFEDRAGGRHDNDFIDFREINVIPTAAEVMCQARPFLPPHAVQIDVSTLIDRQFRLLREDFVAPLREEILLATTKDPKADKRLLRRLNARTFAVVEFKDVSTDFRGPLSLEVVFEQPQQLLAVTRKEKDDAKVAKERKKYWEEHKRLLDLQSLVCFLVNGELLSFATVSVRDVSDLALDDPIICVSFHAKSDCKKAFSLIGRNLAELKVQMVQMSASIFSFAPVLERLQFLLELPFDSEFVEAAERQKSNLSSDDREYFDRLAKVDKQLALLSSGSNAQAIFGTPNSVLLDISQLSAVRLGLQKRVALIQGPPGTGKSFCGALIGKTIIDQTNETVLVVCYTNHALDQFLEDLIDIGVDENHIVRLGGSHKISDRIQGLTLRSVSEKRANTAAEQRLFGKTKGRAEEEAIILDKAAKELQRLNSEKMSWEDAKSILMEVNKEAIRSFQPKATAKGLQVVGKNNKAMTEEALWKLWQKGDGRGSTQTQNNDDMLWTMKKDDRAKLLQSWVSDRVRKQVDILMNATGRYDQAISELLMLKKSSTLQTLRSRRIIGCTTTGAAKFQAEIQAAGVGVLLVEEAGEILEAHILSALQEGMKQIIMIGDHMQLRPKLNTHALSVESNKGFDLNRSLFERLIVGGKLGHECLALQHRMRPEISNLVRTLVYPMLRDSPKVETYPNVAGLSKNLIFINHHVLEGVANGLQQPSEDGLSKENAFEVEMVDSIAKYLLQQGYDASQLVILTPYLGQLNAIRRQLKNVRLGKLDVADLASTGEDVSLDEDRKKIRAATVDNYQGEESDVVLVSLVRSNAKGEIGFLSQCERINVMLSRARHGMILIGNMDTLTKASNARGRQLWCSIANLLQKGGNVFSGLPIVCQRHPQQSAILETPDKFLHLAPNGGCSEPCLSVLKCGHSCPKKCHAPADHSVIVCTHVTESKCARGHLLNTVCGKAPVKCSKTVKVTCQKGHEISILCSGTNGSMDCKVCITLAEKEAKLQAKLAKEAEQQAKKDAEYQKLLAEVEMQKREEQVALQQLELERKRQVQIERIKMETWKLQQEKDIRLKNHGTDVADEIAQMRAEAEKKMIRQENFIAQSNGLSNQPSGVDLNRLLSMEGKELTSLFAPFLGEDTAVLVEARDKGTLRKSDSSALFLRGKKLFVAGSEIGMAQKLFRTTKGDDGLAMDMLCRSKLGDSIDAETPLPVRNLSVPVCFAYCCILGGKKDSQKSIALAVLLGLIVLKHGCDGFDEGTVIEICSSGVAKLFPPGPSPVTASDGAAVRWREQVNIYGAASEAMESLVKMTGLEEVKLKLLEIHAAIDLDRVRMGEPDGMIKKRLHAIFCGNPGTGKTTVARLYGKFLFEMKAIKGHGFEETTGAKLVADGVPALRVCVDKLMGAGGGTLFIDEAYQLSSNKGDVNGRRVLDYLLPELENWIGSMVVVLAGYKKKMEELLEYNEGLPSRFPFMFHFADYTDAELLSIMEKKLETKYQKQALVVEDLKSLRIAIRRLGLGRGKEGFGNARAVDVLLDRVLERQSTRVREEKMKGNNPDAFLLKWSDLLGPDPVVGLETSSAWKELSGMIGLGQVKTAVAQMLEVVKTNAELEKMEKPIQNITLNRCFLGNPGVGKTTVAKLYAEILRDIGLLSKGELIVKTPSDFIGSVLGESEQKTRAILRASEGSVLLIDEAYGLFSKGDSDPYKKGVIDAIVGEVQNVPGDDRCVIMCGYQAQMDEMMREGNPGLARRISIDSAFVFDDFSNDELHLILNQKLCKRDLKASFSAQLCAVNVLAMQRRRRNFGNGGAVETLISEAVQRMNKRLQSQSVVERARNIALIEADFDPDISDERVQKLRKGGAEEIFSGLIGCRDIKKKMQEYADAIAFNEKRGKDRLDGLAFNFRFVGAPGTGKTTVARKMGVMFHALGVLGSDEVVSVSASHLIAEYVGQTGPRTRQKLDDALGRVLFIDEAYRLKEGPFAKEALDEIVNLLTEERYFRKLVVILAGYERDIQQLMRTNAGLESRFSEKIVFDNFSSDECVTMMKKRLFDSGLEMTAEGVRAAKPLFEQLLTTEDWGNGRDVETICSNLSRICAPRLNKLDNQINAGDVDMVLESEVVECISKMLKERNFSGDRDVVHADPPIVQQAQKKFHPVPSKIATDVSKTTSPVATATAAAPSGPPPIRSKNDAAFIDPILDEIERCLSREKDEKEREQLESEKQHLLQKKREWADLEQQEKEQSKRGQAELAQLKKEQAVEANRENQKLSTLKRAAEQLSNSPESGSESERLKQREALEKKRLEIQEQERRREQREVQRGNERQRRKEQLEGAKRRIAEQREKEIERELARQSRFAGFS